VALMFTMLSIWLAWPDTLAVMLLTLGSTRSWLGSTSESRSTGITAASFRLLQYMLAMWFPPGAYFAASAADRGGQITPCKPPPRSSNGVDGIVSRVALPVGVGIMQLIDSCRSRTLGASNKSVLQFNGALQMPMGPPDITVSSNFKIAAGAEVTLIVRCP